jgi:hypothetical protein
MKIRFFHILFSIFVFCCPAGAGTEIDLTQQEKEQLLKDKVILREIPADNKNGKTYEAIGIVRASKDDVSKVLLNYEDYPKFKPNLTKIEIVECNGECTRLNYTLTLPLGKKKKYGLWMSFKKEGDTDVLAWEKADWPGLQECETIKDTTGYWRWEDFPERPGYVLIVYRIYTDPGPIPLGMEWIANLLSKNSVPDVVIKTRKRIYEIIASEEKQKQGKLP